MVDLSIYCTVHHLKVISTSAMRFFFFRGIFVIVVSGDASFGSELSSLWCASIINGAHSSPALFSKGFIINLHLPAEYRPLCLLSQSPMERKTSWNVCICVCVFADTALWLANLHAGGGVLKDLVALIGCFALSTRPRSSRFSSVAFILV